MTSLRLITMSRYDVEELLGSLHSAALVAEEDWKEAQFAIADLKGARAQLKSDHLRNAS